MPRLTINGVSVEVPEGANLIEAARLAGADVPHFCYHPGLSVPGNCRMCLVEIEGSPKLQVACNTPAAEGMRVDTLGPKVREARAGVMEFLLLNHPIDCPVCDCAGECLLQDHYMAHDGHASRLDVPKNRKAKAQDIGPHVMLDAERCILCTRCVRFTREVSQSFELGVFGRGSGARIGLASGLRLDNPYSGNVVDLCPVGALTDKDFRFKSRPWFLKRTDTLCVGCARGCAITLDVNLDTGNRAGGGRAVRVKPRFNPDVNGHWICDEGRYGFGALDEGRLEHPIARGARCTPEHAAAQVAQAIARAVADRGAESVGFLLSPHLTNEALAALADLARGLGAARVSAGSDLRAMGEADGLLRLADKTPNHQGAAALGLDAAGCVTGRQLLEDAAQGRLRVLVVAGWDLERAAGDLAKAALKGAAVVALSAHADAITLGAEAALPLAMWAETEGTMTNHQGQVQRLNKAMEPLGEARPAEAWALSLRRLLEGKGGAA